jgi:uncharacterized protein (DUF302 family)
MRCIITALFAVTSAIAGAAAPWSSDDDDTPKVTDPSVPLTYVGGDGSISIGINAEGETEGQLMGVFGRNDERAVVGQLWWDRTGAGGVQGDYNWLWGATAAEVREDPSRATVARVSFAVAQNGERNRKATLGFGIERRHYSIDGYLSRGLGDGRAAGSVFNDHSRPVSGSDDIGTYTELEITTVETLLARKAYDTEFGLQFSHVFDPLGMRVYGGAGIQSGEGSADARIFSLGIDSPIGRRGWAASTRVDHQRRQGDFEDDHADTRVSFFLRYQFGGRGAFVPTSDQDSPAWIQRAFGRAANAAPRTVDVYLASVGSTTTVTQGPREYSNYFPLAQPDAVSTARGASVTINVLANDADPDGDPLLITAVSTPGNGTAVIQGAAIVYTPHPDFIGTDTFTYSVADPDGGSGQATVTVTVEETPNRSPVARNDQATTEAGASVFVAVLGNDSDADDDPLSVIEVGSPTNGTAVLTGDSILYTPRPGFIGSDTFTYTISDGRGGTATAVVQIDVTPAPNQPPIASSDVAVTLVNTPVTVAVLANDFDADGDTLVLLAVGTPSSGTAVVAGDLVLYTPATGYIGTDSFPYTVADGRGGTASALVTVRVDPVVTNLPPVAQNDSATTPAGVAVTIPVLANDSDPDGDPLTVLSVGTPALGTATISGSDIVYVPASGATGSDTFSYTVGDGNGGVASALIVVTITGATNSPPIAQNDTASTTPGNSVTIPVLANDSDPDGDTLVLLSVDPPALGTASIVGNDVLYTPSVTGGIGTHTFSYTVGDGNGGTATALIEVIVSPPPNTPPVALDDNVSVAPGVPTSIDVLNNDSDADGDALTVVSVTTPASGTATIAGNMVVYTAFVPFPGTDAFNYTISDGQGGTATATVRITAGTIPNTPPVAGDDFVSTQIAVPVIIPVLDNDSDADGDPLTILSVTTPAQGTATITGFLVTYQSTSTTFTGIDTFQYTISDGNGGLATATVTVTVMQTNSPPVANDDVATTGNMPVVIPVLDNDSDPDGHPLAIIATSQPANGLVAFNNTTVTYSPDGGFVGTDTFTYTISDGHGGEATAQVTVTVIP